MGRKRETKQLVKDISQGVFGAAVDLSLFLVCFSAGWIVSSMSSGKKANLGPLLEMLKLYPKLRIKVRQALHIAKRNKLISHNYQTLTPAGQDRLLDALPKFKRHPVWSGSLWLITYDIAENHKQDRDSLRNFLIDQGFGRLQDSIYLSPFDPTDQVRKGVRQLSIQGEVLISRMGKDGHLGDMDLNELIAHVYDLDSIQTRYQFFITKLTNHPVNPQNAPFLFLEYLSILKQDPQLPPQLLPPDWGGDKAYKLVKNKLLPLLANNQMFKKILSKLQIASK